MKKITRFTKAIGFLLIVLFMGTSVVAADYIGPDRTYTVQEATSCGYRYTGSGYSSCGANGYLGDPCTCNITCDTCLTGTGGCISIPSGTVDSTCGGGFSEADRWVNYTNRTVSHPLAVASTAWSCPVPGSNGWCHSPFQVQLNGVDNYSSAGYYITALEGVLDGVPFFADAVDTITIQIEEGTHHLDFWALSSYGDSSYHFIENYYVDTVNPIINASLNGTPGEHDWFVSNTTLTVTFTDPAPGSGVDFTRALSNGVDFSVVNPVTFTEGVYFLQLDVRDYAGHTAQTLYNLMVDTTPPAVTANQPPVELAVDGIAGGGYVNGSVVFSGTCSDATSGVNRIEISTDGSALTSIAPNPDGTWTLDWDSSMLPDGTYTPVITAVDNAGNRTDITMQPLTLDNSAPSMSITGGWYIWDSGHIVVYDSRAGIQRIELSVRDDQNRWPAREWDYDTSKLEMDLQWDRKFGDGTVAPPGTYDVLLQAWDRLGNGRWLTAHIYIPEAGATAVIPYEGMLTAGNAEPTGTPVPTQPVAGETPVVVAGAGDPQPTNTPVPTSTTVSVPISGGEDSTLILAAADKSGDSAPANTTPISSGILWGAAAMAAGAAAAIVSQKQLEETRKKEQAKLDAAAQERMIQRWSNVVASYGGTYDHEAEVKRIAEKEKFWHDYWVASQEKYIEEQRIKANEEAAAAAAYAEFLANNPEAATMIAYQERMKAEQEAAKKAAEEYSNQVKAFRDGEEASNASYQLYQTKQFHEKEQDDLWNIQQENLKAFHENEAQAYAAYLEQQKEYEANQEKQKEMVLGYTVPDYMKDAYLGTGPSTESVFTPDEELQEVIDANIAKQVADKPTMKDILVNFLNSASSGLGILHDRAVTTGDVVRDATVTFLNNASAGLGILHDFYLDLKEWNDSKPIQKMVTAFVWSLIPGLGDGTDLLKEWIKKGSDEPVDGLIVKLSIAGLFFDFFPFDGFVGDSAIAAVKALANLFPPGPAREVLEKIIKKTDLDGFIKLGDISKELLKHPELIEPLIKNPKALETILNSSSEVIEKVAKEGPEVIPLIDKFGDNGLKYFLEGGAESIENMTLLAKLDGDPGRIITDLVSVSTTSKSGAIFQLEQIKRIDPSKIKGVEVEIPGGRADLILTDGTIIDYKSWNWYANSYQDPDLLVRIIERTESQLGSYKLYQIDNEIDAPIKLVFESIDGMPIKFKEEMGKLGIIIEVK